MFDKKSDTPLCPFDKKACVKERCMGWQTGPVERMVDGAMQPTIHSDCFVIWNLIYQKAIANRTDGTQVAIESFRNEVVRQNEGLAQLMVSSNAISLQLPSRLKDNGG